jgi:hypothetical protein
VKTKLLKAILVLGLASSSANAGILDGLEGEAKVKATMDDSGDVGLKAEATVRMTYMMDIFKFLIEARLMTDLEGSGVNKLTLGKIITQANVQMTKSVYGTRVTLILGKQRMAFGQDLQRISAYINKREGLTYDLNNEDEVVGLTFVLPDGVFGLVDQLAGSIYETGKGDLSVDGKLGFSLKATKALNNGLIIEASALVKNSKASSKTEARQSLGVVYKINNTYKVFANGFLIQNNPRFPAASWGLVAGVSTKFGPGVIAVEGELIGGTAQSLVASYNLPVDSWIQDLIIAPEIRLTHYEVGSTVLEGGVTAYYPFGEKNPERLDSGYRFGNSKR